MKIGILTQPLQSNYGGLLQAWALQKTLEDMGNEATIINRIYGNPNIPLWKRLAGKVKNKSLVCLGKRKRYIPVTDEIKEYSEQNVIRFRQNRYLGISPELKSNKELLNYIENQGFDAYVVGSDQVWRPMYSPNLMTYFLDFVKNNNQIKKIAYAASFGVDNWEFSEKQTCQAAELAQLFDLITVRESSGVNLVEKYFKCKATHVLDPTLLLPKENYIELVNNSTCELKESDGELFAYVLDSSEDLANVIKECSKVSGLKPYYCNYETPAWKLKSKSQIAECIVPPVEQWLKSFEDAKMVITDSFHGTVFAIIFNKPFWVIINEGRGRERFISLLKMFRLENRIVESSTKFKWDTPIDWNFINLKRIQLSKHSKAILYNNLKR